MKLLSKAEIAAIPLGKSYRKDGEFLSYRNSDGEWAIITTDEHDKRLTYKNSSGRNVIYFCWGSKYALGYDSKSKKYFAGCQSLTYKQSIRFFNKEGWEYSDANMFMEAINQHQETLKLLVK